MALDSTKSFKLFLYSLVDKNHLFINLEPLTKKNEAPNKNGVVGKMGIITPITPVIKNKKPKKI